MVSKNFTQFGYLVSFIPAILVIYGNLNGGIYAGLNAFFAFFILVILDWIMPSDTSHPEEVSDTFADLILIVHVIVHTIALGSLFYGVKMEILVGPYIFLAVLSTGINSGQSGIIVAHELIHRKDKIMRVMGIWNLLTVLYGHWYIEHKYGHHRFVGTFKDPATARYNESVYKFIVRTIPQQFISSFRIERQRQENKGRKGINPKNFVINAILAQIVVIISIFLLLGPLYVLVFIGQAVIAIILLEMVNYIEHYGLLREEDQPFKLELAWNTDVVSSRYFLLELVRHSDHHYRANKPYQTLLSYNNGKSCNVPTLPAGYWGMFFIVFFPWIWRRIIHPLIPEPMIDLYFQLSDSDNVTGTLHM